jgi:simple sugar transport system ATP-binding protein
MLELRNITKKFGSVLANDKVNIVVKPGTIHAIVGENGAGKSTAMRIAYGFYTPDSGEILVDGHVHDIRSPHDAIALGIGMVHQHFMLVEPMTVAENIVLGSEPGTATRTRPEDCRKARFGSFLKNSNLLLTRMPSSNIFPLDSSNASNF